MNQPVKFLIKGANDKNQPVNSVIDGDEKVDLEST